MVTASLLTLFAATSAQTCNAIPQKEVHEAVTIPSNLFEDAQKRARLINLLRESIYDASKSVTNRHREGEIKKLFRQIAKE